MKITETNLPGVKLIEPARFTDERGVLSETYNRQALAAAGLCVEFVQDNHTFTWKRGTVRGLHYQIVPFAQAKLVRVTRGVALDVVVDIRRSSPTFGKHLAVVLSADTWQQLFIPAGFAHGFCTVEDATEVQYKLSAHHSPTHARGIRWNDPALGIDWGVDEAEAILNERDRGYPGLRDAVDLF